LGESELPKGATFGLDYPSTFRINTQVYLQWYVSFLSSLELQDNFLRSERQKLMSYLGSKFKP
jgi:D-amino-acid oxidase